jgi:hypothetical protein
MQLFDEHGVSFVSVTQQFNSSTPMGRLTLNILLSFAQFERETISERTRDKVSAARREGKWMGGYPVLGYDPDASRARLVVNEAEAVQVREIFALFLQKRSLIATLEAIQERGWRLKSWTTRTGEHHTGKPLDRHSLVRLLSNVVYLGEVKHKGKVYAGEQPAIVERAIWKQAKALLERQERGGKVRERNRQGALLQDLLVCAGCGRRMVAGYTTKGGQRYVYYVCQTAQKRGTRACPGKLVVARRIEAAVVRAVHGVAGRPDGEPLRHYLPVDSASWEELERSEQHEMLAKIVERITYDRRLGQGRVRWREEVGNPQSEILIRANKEPLVRQTPPPPIEKPISVERVGEHVPRITKLLALAVRLEGLLQRRTAKDHADLARLGGVSRARITQVMNLRNLAPVLQERILLLRADPDGAGVVNERTLRQIGSILDWREQLTAFERLSPELNGAKRR